MITPRGTNFDNYTGGANKYLTGYIETPRGLIRLSLEVQFVANLCAVELGRRHGLGGEVPESSPPNVHG